MSSSLTEKTLFKILILFLFCFSLIYYFYYGVFQPRSGRKPDFDPYFTAAYCLKNNINPYNTNSLLDASKKIGAQKTENSINKCVYPPFFMQLLKPLLYFNIKTARIIWACILNFLFIFIAFRICYKLFDKNFYLTAFIFSLFFLFNPLYITLALGQVNILILLLLLLVFYCLKKDYKILFSVFLACAALIKIIPAIIYFYLLIRKKYKLLIISMLVFSFIFIVSFLFNIYEYKEYFGVVLPQFSQGVGGENIYNISFDGFLKKHNLQNFFSVLFSIILILIIVYKNFINKYDDDYLFGLIIGFSLLIPKTLWEHHTILIFIPFIILILEISTNKLQFKNNIFLFSCAIAFAVLAVDLKYYDPRLNEFPLSLIRYIKLYALIIFNFVFAFGLKKIL